tara:strand:+ start:324 stop:575 length:252 start_codon:yes stop_codon:yes gene_type:complete
MEEVEVKKWIPDVTFTEDTSELTEALISAQQRYPLIAIAKNNLGVTLGGIGLEYPVMLSDIHSSLVDIQTYIIMQEKAATICN